MPKRVFSRENGEEWIDRGLADTLLDVEYLTDEEIYAVLQHLAAMRGGDVEYEIRDVLI